MAKKIVPIRAGVAPSNVSTINLNQIGDTVRVKASRVLKAARGANLDEVMVIGRTDDGGLFIKSSLNAGQSLWLIEKLKAEIVDSKTPWAVI